MYALESRDRYLHLPIVFFELSFASDPRLMQRRNLGSSGDMSTNGELAVIGFGALRLAPRSNLFLCVWAWGISVVGSNQAVAKVMEEIIANKDRGRC